MMPRYENNKPSTHNLYSERTGKIRGQKLSMMVSTLETLADLKHGMFRKIFNLHFSPSG
jgi:hypothetical protein